MTNLKIKGQKGQSPKGIFGHLTLFGGNQKGQAFSVFKILIAAIVSLAILMLLMNIMGMINFNPSNEPETAAKELTKDAYSSIYTPKSKPVTFNEAHPLISKQHVRASGGAAIVDEQIVFCDSATSSLATTFETKDGTILTYKTPKSDKEVTLHVLCTDDETSLTNYPQFSTCPVDSLDDIVCFLTVGPKK